MSAGVKQVIIASSELIMHIELHVNGTRVSPMKDKNYMNNVSVQVTDIIVSK